MYGGFALRYQFEMQTFPVLLSRFLQETSDDAQIVVLAGDHEGCDALLSDRLCISAFLQ